MPSSNTNSDPDTFKSTFGSRIDALTAAIRALGEGDANSEYTIRRLAHTLSGPAALHEMRPLLDATQKVQRVPVSQLSDNVRALIQTLRDEATDTDMLLSRVLIVGGMPAFNTDVSDQLGSPSRHVIQVDTAEAATQTLNSDRVSCIILNVILPDLDSRSFFLTLRENPLTASIPILFVGARISDQIKEQSQLHSADGFCENPNSAGDVIQWVQERLRRTPEPLRSSRRDVLTGLLNQAAMREAFVKAQSERNKTHDPLTLACIAVDSGRHLLTAFSENTREEILLTMGVALSGSLRASDSVSRWGTYEFVVLLPGEDTFGGTRAMEKVLEEFRRQCVNPSNPAPHDLAVAIGVTEVGVDTGCEEAISKVEHLVYQATAMGGNRVISGGVKSHPTRIHRVLILSADKVACDVLSGMLEKNGFPTSAYSTLEETLSADLESQRFHLVIIDQDFPPSGGFPVLEQLRNDSQNSRLHIVMLISENVEENVTKALELGASDYLVRPFSPDHLISRTRRLLSRRSVDAKTGKALKLLIVDTDTKALVFIATILHQRGFHIYLANSHEMARKRFKEIGANAVMIDITQSPTSVQAFTEALGDDHDISRTPFILMATPEQEVASISFFPANVTGYVTKPIDAINLPEQIELVLQLPASATRLDCSMDHLNTEIKQIVGG